MICNISEIRKKFINFFKKKGHKELPSSSLVPINDNSILFINAGMNQFKTYFLNPIKCIYKSITTVQRCLRAGGKKNDLEKVGYTFGHHTFFEMLGNFSFGSYFKYNAIKYAWELLTNIFNIPKEKLLITVDSNDKETYNIWYKIIGISENKIIKIGNKKNINSSNFWKMGDIGPCGPSTEIFFDHGYGQIKSWPTDRYIEIWNIVFIKYNINIDGSLSLLPKYSVDTGMGLERITAVLQNVKDNYDIDIFVNIIGAIANVIKIHNMYSKSFRVIADHIRACIFLILDNVLPSNESRGYILRRIIRRAAKHGYLLGEKSIFLYKLVYPLIELLELKKKYINLKIEKILYIEEEKFLKTINIGLYYLNYKNFNNKIDGFTLFKLYDTYGLPLEFILEYSKIHNLKLDILGFNIAMAAQRNRSRLDNKKNIFNCLNIESMFLGYKKTNNIGIIKSIYIYNKFKPVNFISSGIKSIIILNETVFYSEGGGQVGDIGYIKNEYGKFIVQDTKKYSKCILHFGYIEYGKLGIGNKVYVNVNKKRRYSISLNHTAIHLLYSTLCKKLDSNILQKGSFINDKYFRLDFSYTFNIDKNKLKEIEFIINKQIWLNNPINKKKMYLIEAYKQGLIKLYIDKTINIVRVLKIGNYSIELCAGIHADYTGELGIFKIINIYNISSGIKRIEGVTEKEAYNYIYKKNNIINDIKKKLRIDDLNLINKINEITKTNKKIEKELRAIKKEEKILIKKKILIWGINVLNGFNLIISSLKNYDMHDMHDMEKQLKTNIKGIIILSSVKNDKINIVVSVYKNLIKKIKAFEIIEYLINILGGVGGGKNNLAQAISKEVYLLTYALIKLEKKIKNILY